MAYHRTSQGRVYSAPGVTPQQEFDTDEEAIAFLLSGRFISFRPLGDYSVLSFVGGSAGYLYIQDDRSVARRLNAHFWRRQINSHQKGQEAWESTGATDA